MSDRSANIPIGDGHPTLTHAAILQAGSDNLGSFQMDAMPITCRARIGVLVDACSEQPIPFRKWPTSSPWTPLTGFRTRCGSLLR